MDLLSLHHSESRYEEFPSAPKLFFSQELQCWVCFDPELVVAFLRDERLVVTDIVEPIRKREIRFKRQFPNVLYAAQGIPLLMEGTVHREIRRNLAELVIEGRSRVVAALPMLMERHVKPLAGRSEVEWVSACLAPLVGDLFCRLCNTPEAMPYPVLTITRLFDRFASLTALTEADRQIDELRQSLARDAPQADPAMTIALFVVGRDSLLGTLASSLYSIFRRNLDRRFADIEFPDYPPETGVAVSERLAAEAVPVGSQTIAAGDRLRLYYQPISGAESTVNKHALFGTGAHSCLGRQVSLDAWLALTGMLKGFTGVLTSASCEFEANNLFAMPRYLRTELNDR